MTGGGFGGAIVAVLAADAVPDFIATLEQQYAQPRGAALNPMIEGKGRHLAGIEL